MKKTDSSFSLLQQAHQCIENGNFSNFKRIIKKIKIKIDEIRLDGYTPLQRACFENKPEFVKYLIRIGSDINVKSEYWSNCTPLHIASHYENCEVCKILLENGANCEIKNFKGEKAIDVTQSEEIKKLFEKKKEEILEDKKELEVTKKEIEIVENMCDGLLFIN